MNQPNDRTTEPVAMSFLGREFLLWLWYRSEVGFARLQGASGTPVDLWVDDRLVLQGEGTDPQRFDFRGGAPATSISARTAVLEGRAVTAARFGLRSGELQFSFELREDLSLGGLKLPDTKHEPGEEFRGRIEQAEALVRHVDDLFAAFAALRLGDSWDRAEVPRIRTWLTTGEPPTHER